MARLSVIIPTRHIDQALRERTRAIAARLPKAEIIVVEPSDAPAADVELAPGSVLARAPRGRGTQCNEGAKIAAGDLLLFLHDDTALPPDAAAAIQLAFEHDNTALACFRLRFDHRHWILRLYGYFSRFDSYLTSFGDQGILIRRAFFDELGGFPNWPIFEDVELLRGARRRAPVRKLPATLTTSAVRFVENGIIRQQLLNAELMLRFALGAAPERLRARYEDDRREQRKSRCRRSGAREKARTR